MLKNIELLQTPCYVISEALLEKNLKILNEVKQRTSAKILLAQKSFSMYSTYPQLAKYLDGTTASSLFEAKLGYEEFGKEVHIFAPAYRPCDFDDITSIADHIVFNSFSQLNAFKDKIKNCGRKIEIGLRVNPEYSEQDVEIYDPCGKNSRLGVTKANFVGNDVSMLDGLHFHTLCEQNSDALERTLESFEEKFGEYLKGLKWVNFGGGHHITRDDYDVDLLCNLINCFKQKYGVQVYLEPGEAVSLNAGFLVSTVLDIVDNGMKIAILDTSAACHMPDVLEMPYTPKIIGAEKADVKKFTYRLGAHTCLAGDVIGDYSFENELRIGDRLIFCDMAIYSMVKNNTFNGINLPDIVLEKFNGDYHLIKRFGYEDFKSRL